MTISIRRWFARVAAVVALWPASAQAQTAVQSFEELKAIVRAEETVIVTEMTGRRAKGTVTAVEKDSLSLTTGGQTQTFARSEVRTVRVADGLGNAALIGAGAGLGAALGVLAIIGSGDGYVLPSAKVGAPLLLSGIGALAGALVDRAHEGGRLLYVAAGKRSGLAVSPLLGKGRLGVLVSVRF